MNPPSTHRGGRIYQLMEIGVPPSPTPLAGLDAPALVPGFYVSTIDELTDACGRDGRRRQRGYYAVFRPMDDPQDTDDETSALYFGPFPSERDADGFVRRMSGNGSEHS